MSTAAGSTPAAARFLAIRPSPGPNRFEVPVSTRMSLSPALTSHSLTAVDVAAFERLCGALRGAGDTLGLDRKRAVIEHRHPDASDLDAVDAGCLRAGERS